MHQHRFTYSEEERRKRQNPEAILTATGLGRAMTFMDIGSNDGFFTIPAAHIVGKEGSVYAVDIDEAAIMRLQHKAHSAQLDTIRTQVGKAEDTVFCEGCADIIFYGTVLHDFADPLQVLKNAKTMLRAGGKVVNLDWKKKPTVMGPPLEKRLSEQEAETLFKKADLRVTTVEDLSSEYYLITATG